MTIDELRQSLTRAEPPSSSPPLVRALWLDGRGDWSGAHGVAREDESPAGSWVHAYLHRKEGDNDNAAYWYRRAAKPPCTGDLAGEWESIARALLEG